MFYPTNGTYEPDEVDRLKKMIRHLCYIIRDEYPESDERYQFAMNCLTDVEDDE